MTAEPFLHVRMDAFFAMLPPSSIGDPDGIVFETVDDGGKPSVVIHIGPVAERVFRGMRRAIAAMAAEGNNLIVDDVMLDGQMAEYEALLGDFTLYRVGVFASLEVLEERERNRGDRLIGLARWQFTRVHAGVTYDLGIDTSDATPLECARRIKERFGL
jgi:chloramphenicol 3-O phosphotransferase